MHSIFYFDEFFFKFNVSIRLCLWRDAFVEFECSFKLHSRIRWHTLCTVRAICLCITVDHTCVVASVVAVAPLSPLLSYLNMPFACSFGLASLMIGCRRRMYIVIRVAGISLTSLVHAQYSISSSYDFVDNAFRCTPLLPLIGMCIYRFIQCSFATTCILCWCCIRTF